MDRPSSEQEAMGSSLNRIFHPGLALGAGMGLTLPTTASSGKLHVSTGPKPSAAPFSEAS